MAMKTRHVRVAGAALASCVGILLFAGATPAHPATSGAPPVLLALPAARDTTIYVGDATNDLANGAGTQIFVGKAGLNRQDVQPRLHRGLMAFDLGAIPPGSTVLSATLTLVMDRSSQASGSRAIALHRVNQSWGEGASNSFFGEGIGAAAQPSDATARSRFHGGLPWGAIGGDFAAAHSAVLTVNLPATYTWGSTAGMVADVQAWVNAPAQNHGWMLIGEEPVDNVTTSKRFGSRTHPNAGLRPLLRVAFAPAAPPTTMPTGTASATPSASPSPTATISPQPRRVFLPITAR
jgi:hypothetical protein